MIKVFVFDFDGIILESVPIKDQAIYHLFENIKQTERELVLDLHRQNPGINRRDRIRMLLTQGLGQKEVSPDLLNGLLMRFTSLVSDGLMECPEVPGVRKFLDEICQQKPCYVVSAAPRDEVRAVAEARGFSEYFLDILSTPPAKAEHLKKIIKQEMVQPESVLFIGDKISDYNAAKKAGTVFLGRICALNPTFFSDGTQTFLDFNQDLFQKYQFRKIEKNR